VFLASGVAATNTVVQTLSPGDHVICIDDVYGGTQRLFRNVVHLNSSIDFTFVDMAKDVESIERACTDKTKLIWVETPTNPTLKITDIRAVCRIAAAKGGIKVCVGILVYTYNMKIRV
jgi:cystathionine gamma-lyase